jgi:hypothetical protein
MIFAVLHAFRLEHYFVSFFSNIFTVSTSKAYTEDFFYLFRNSPIQLYQCRVIFIFFLWKGEASGFQGKPNDLPDNYFASCKNLFLSRKFSVLLN